MDRLLVGSVGTVGSVGLAALAALALGGCATAAKGNSIVGGLNDDAGPRTDATDIPAPDASLIDAPPEQLTLSQNVSETISLDNSIACLDRVNFNSLENHYYRLFSLDDYSIRTTFHIQRVDFAIEYADGGPGSTTQPATVKLGTYGGKLDTTTMDLAQIRALTSKDISIRDGSGTRMSVDITGDVAAGSILVVELALPDGSAAGSLFFIGSNPAGERRPAFTTSACRSVPASLAKISTAQGRPEMDALISVTGTH